MRVENNKIVEATENELFDYYLRVGWDDVMSFPDYLDRMKDAGVTITKWVYTPKRNKSES